MYQWYNAQTSQEIVVLTGIKKESKGKGVKHCKPKAAIPYIPLQQIWAMDGKSQVIDIPVVGVLRRPGPWHGIARSPS